MDDEERRVELRELVNRLRDRRQDQLHFHAEQLRGPGPAIAKHLRHVSLGQEACCCLLR